MTSATGPGEYHPGRNPSRRAFTLLELVLVLLLLALLAGLTAPALGRFSRARQSRDQAAHLLALIQYAQTQAMARGMTYRLQVDVATGDYWLTCTQDGVFVRPAEAIGRTFSVAAQGRLDWGDAAASTSAAQRGYLQFDPDGGHDLDTLRFIDRAGDVYLIASPALGESFALVLQPAA